MTENLTRFQKIVQKPANAFDKDVKQIADYLLEKDRTNELIPIRDYFNGINDKAYTWHVKTLEQILSLDTIANSIDDAIKAHIKSMAGDTNSEIAQSMANSMADMVVVIAPWHGTLKSLNTTLQSTNAKIYKGVSRAELLLLKDFVIDKVDKKLEVIENFAMKAAKDMIPSFENKQVMLNEETSRYELV